VNPADAPIMILAMTSERFSRGQMYDMASTNLAQRISQLKGVGQVTVGGGSLPAVRVELNPTVLNKLSIGFDEVRNAITSTNANRPKGFLDDGERYWQVQANDQAKTAAEYVPIIVAYRNGAAIRIGDLGRVEDSVQDLRNHGMANGKPAVLLIINRQPNANIIETVDRVKDLLPELRASIPQDVSLEMTMERTVTIRASLREVERTLTIAVALVILVVFVFLRSGRATLIPAIAVPISLIGTFAAMYLLGFSLNNLSLMALTIATGFVVDDAIVVLENVSRYIEKGMEPFEAALIGAREVAFTVVSMSVSLVAVFIPILFMGGIIGRIFREFAITLSVAIGISLVVSLTTTPMMCSRLLKRREPGKEGRFSRWSENAFNKMVRGYAHSLGWALRFPLLMLIIFLATVALNFYLYAVVPKGFFPQQDTGLMIGAARADQSTSFQAMRTKLENLMAIVMRDPAVANVTGFTGSGGFGSRNSAQMFVTLKPLKERDPVDVIQARLRTELSKEPGVNLFLNPIQDLRAGGRQSDASQQFTLRGEDLNELRTWATRLEQALRDVPEITDVNSDQQNRGLQMTLIVDRTTAARLGISMRSIDTALNLAFGQSQVSTIYQDRNQYRVVMEAAPEYWQSPETLSSIFVLSNTKAQVPLSAVARYEPTLAPLSVNHQGNVRRHHHLLQPGARRGHVGGERRDPRHALAHRRAHQHLRVLRGHRQDLPAGPREAAVSHPRRTPHRLHRARHPLREPGAPHHDPLHAALGGRGRAAGAAALQDRVLPDRADRRDPAHRHREEERDPHDRLRAARGARAEACAARRDLPGGPAALPPDHDDHARRDAGRDPARDRQRRRRGAAPAARHLHRRRPAGEPAAHALHRLP
jgi:multidrug efflux pump